MHSLLKSLSLLLFICLLAACKPTADNNKTMATDISGADFAQGLSLTDHNGKPTSLQDFKGKAVVLFFGYTHCPDVCPTTMLDLKHTMKLLGKRADEVQVLFVTLILSVIRKKFWRNLYHRLTHALLVYAVRWLRLMPRLRCLRFLRAKYNPRVKGLTP